MKFVGLGIRTSRLSRSRHQNLIINDTQIIIIIIIIIITLLLFIVSVRHYILENMTRCETRLESQRRQ